MFVPKRSFEALALETVDFQDRSFGDKMTSIVRRIYEMFDAGTVTSASLNRDPLIKMMEDLILKEKGIRTRFVCNDAIGAILPFYPNKNFNMLHEFLRGNFTIRHQEELLKNANGKRGTVDLKKAKLGGYFSEGTSIVYINFYVLKTTFRLTPAEVTAVTLHELGHAFTACEYADRLTRTNQVLANASREIFKKNGKKDLDYVFKELNSINKDITIEEVDAIVNGDRIVGGVKWHKFLVDTVVSELKNDKYNENSFEQMADNFTARHGYGKELTVGLDKLHSAMGSGEKFASARYMGYVISTIVFLMLPFAAIAMLTVAPVAGVLLSLFWFLIFIGSGDGHRDNTYDELKQRYVRIRAEIITLLKDQNIPKSTVEDAVNQIKIIDTAINSTSDINEFARIASNFVFASNRQARKSIEHQKQLEALVNNDLFMRAAQLKIA